MTRLHFPSCPPRKDRPAVAGRPGSIHFVPARSPLTEAEAADALGLSPVGVRRLIHSGRLTAERHGRAWQIRPEALMTYVDAYGFTGPT